MASLAAADFDFFYRSNKNLVNSDSKPFQAITVFQLFIFAFESPFGGAKTKFRMEKDIMQ